MTEQIETVYNENDIRLIGATAFNPFSEYTSSSRGQMQANAISQHYVISGCKPNMIQTGADIEYGRFSNSITTPHNMVVFSIVNRYIPSQHNGIQLNPQQVVIYQTFDEGSRPLFGIIDITRFSSSHPKFGFEYKPTEEAQQIRVGNSIPKGTVLYDTPAKDKHGLYSPGIDLNTLYSSLEGTIEDSILIAKDVAPLLKTKTFTTRVFELGEKEFPLNLYGDDDNYKVMPDIGEYCIPTGQAYSGIVMAKREYRPDLLPIMFTKKSTRIFDSVTDVPLDGNGQEARVIDIIVYKQPKTNTAVAPKVMEQLDKYANAYRDFCERIVSEYRKIMAKTNGNAEFTADFDQLIKHCMAITNEQTNDERTRNVPIQKVSNFNRKLDDITIIVTTEYTKEVGPGFKITGLHGNKGVIADVVTVEPSQMPYDPITGIRADICIGVNSTFNRMNQGQTYEVSLKAAMLELKQWVCNTVNLNESTPNLRDKVIRLPRDVLEPIFARLERFYEICSNKHYDFYKSMSFQEKTVDLYHMIHETPIIWMPHGNNRRMLHVFKALKEEGFLSDPHCLRFWNPHKQCFEDTATPQRIGPQYYICLEKIGDDAAAVSTAATQPNGIIVPLTSKDKTTQQIRKQATKFPGESEGRLLVGSGPSGLAAVLHDRSNNPETVDKILTTIYTTDRPTDIDDVINPNEINIGANRPLQILRHFIQTNGTKMVYAPFDPSQQVLSKIDPITGAICMEIDESDDEQPKQKGSRGNSNQQSNDDDDDKEVDLDGNSDESNDSDDSDSVETESNDND